MFYLIQRPTREQNFFLERGCHLREFIYDIVQFLGSCWRSYISQVPFVRNK